MITLHAVDLGAATSYWTTRSLDRLAATTPRGRVAGVLSGPQGGVIVDGTRPPAQALAGVSPAVRRAVFEALVEDLAVASLYDASEEGLNAALATAARLSERHDLAFDRLEKAALPAYPNVADFDHFEGDIPHLVSWKVDLVTRARAAVALRDHKRRSDDLPECRITGLDVSLVQDLLDGLLLLLQALNSPGVSIVALGLWSKSTQTSRAS